MIIILASIFIIAVVITTLILIITTIKNTNTNETTISLKTETKTPTASHKPSESNTDNSSSIPQAVNKIENCKIEGNCTGECDTCFTGKDNGSIYYKVCNECKDGYYFDKTINGKKCIPKLEIGKTCVKRDPVCTQTSGGPCKNGSCIDRICLNNDEIDETCENDIENSICNSPFYRELTYAPGPDENDAKKICENECNNNNDCKAYGIDIWEYKNLDLGYQCKHLYDKNLTNYDNNNKVKYFNNRAYNSITTEVYVSNENNNYEALNKNRKL